MTRSRHRTWIGLLAAVLAIPILGVPQQARADNTNTTTAATVVDDPSSQPAFDADGNLVAAPVTRLTTPKPQPNSTCSSTSGCIQVTRSTAARPASETGTRAVPAAGTVAAAASTPDYCWAWAADTTSNEWWALGRKSGCFHGRYNIIVYNTEGEVVGRSYLDIALRASSETLQAGWNFDIDVSVWGVAGIGDPSTITMKTRPFSNRGAIAGALSWGKEATLYWVGVTYLERPGLAVKQIVSGVGSFWDFTISRTGWANVRTQTIVGPDSRCDQYAKYYYGCVYPQQPGRITYNAGTYPSFTKHVKAAIKSGLKGGVGTGTYLSRITSAASIAKNGTTACPAKITKNRPKGTQCDEYPFRSTKQGAWTNGTHVARTFSWCNMTDKKRTGSKGFSRCFISTGDNTGAGAKLGLFYKTEHILSGDKFQVGFS